MHTVYHKDTPYPVRQILESAMNTKRRLRIFLGDNKTGRDWGEESFVVGTISHSKGQTNVPLMIANGRSIGGSAIFDQCIVKIMEAGKVLYQHHNYHQPTFTIGKAANGDAVAVFANGDNVANFKTLPASRRWVAFMTGLRMAK